MVLAIGGAALAGPAQQGSRSELRLIPDELYRYAVANGCAQVRDFYINNSEIRQPPYVYGILAATDEDAYRDNSAALWCQRTIGSAVNYILLLKLEGKPWPGNCVPRIENQSEGDVLGLSVIRRLDESLEYYVDASNMAALPPGVTKQRARGPAIRSAYDGTGTIYYCFRGRWLRRPLDW